MSRKPSTGFTLLLVMVAAVIGAASALVAQSAWQWREQPKVDQLGRTATPTLAAQPTPYLVNRPSYNDALKACGYHGPEDPDGPIAQCMSHKYNYVFSGTKTIAKAVQTTEASGQAGMADRVEALQAEVDDLEQDINVINGPTGLGARQSDGGNSTVSAQIQAIQNAIQELQSRQAQLCGAVTRGFGTLRFSVCG